MFIQDNQNYNSNRLLRYEIQKRSLTQSALEDLEKKLGLSTADFVRLLMNELPITPAIAEVLAKTFEIPKAVWLGQSKRFHGGKRQGAGRKKTGKVSFLVRLTDSPENIQIIKEWMSRQKNISQTVSALVLQHINSV
jgi:plasmid maintenance system antidote protein VapI